jgi:leader peptidase (prepilin peptidase) / N-methyltransferase
MIEEAFILISAISIGSFGNNLISYFTRKKEFEIGRSLCFCGEKYLGTIELIPILNFAFLKGKCKTCKAKLPGRYLVIEILSGFLGILCYYDYGISIEFFINFIILFLLLLIGSIDFLEYIIPNKLIFPLLFIILLKIFFMHQNIFLSLIVSAGIIIILLSANKIYNLVKKKDAIGYGDIKLIGILILLYTFPISLIGIWISSLLGIAGYFVFKKYKNNKIPFGFYLCMSFILINFFYDKIMQFIYILYRIQ